jgi:ATP-dependent Clp protease ATP-binding subunit ClpX
MAPLGQRYYNRDVLWRRNIAVTMGKDIDIKEIQKDLSDYLAKKYGRKVQFAEFGTIPEPADDNVELGEKPRKPEIDSIRFDMKPTELKAYLDEYLVKQEEAKEVLATKICTHFNRIKRFEMHSKNGRNDTVGHIKNNIIMIGPTGVGKTFLVKLIARKIGVPFVKGDATKFSETGYVGGDVEDLVRDLVFEAGGDIEMAQYGIIYLDEVDKIASSNNLIGPDVSRSGVQRALLKPMEETEVELKVPHDPVSQMEAVMEFQKTGKREKKKINTKHILFIMSGAFNGLQDIIEKRLNQQGIGFGAEIKSREAEAKSLKKVMAEDLIGYGFESEFIGRLPVITTLDHLEVEDLFNILRNPKSQIIGGKKRDFKAYGIDIQFEEEALYKIAENAWKERTGARGLVSAVERVLLKFEHRLPSTDIHHLVVTRAMVEDPPGELEKILADPDDGEREAGFQRLFDEEKGEVESSIRKKEREFREKYGISFSDERIGLITRRVIDQRTDIDSVIEQVVAMQNVARDFKRSFYNRTDIQIDFTDEAIDHLAEKCWERESEPLSLLKESFHNYEHGLRLIKERTGKREFLIPAQGVENPDYFLNLMIRETYKSE